MPRHARLPLTSVLCLALSGCATVPDLGPLPAAVGPSPQILPLDQLIAAAQGGRLTAAMGDALVARANRLRARAAAMRGPVQDPATRARLAAAIARGVGS
ncbi:MAG: hypothetical protein Q8O82_04010 [Pseudorhodobacter sp.]|nr:hypothetical protein [Pseudorhodobacter sp.]